MENSSAWTSKACDICQEADNLTAIGTRRYQTATRNGHYEMIMEDVICGRCGFIFASKIPKNDFLINYYKNAHTRNSDFQIIEPDYDKNARIQVINKYLLKGSSILEIGSNDGNFCDQLAQEGFDVTGLDPLMNNAQRNVVNEFIDGSNEVHLKQYDAVISYYVLEHVVNTRKWLDSILKHLKKDGILIIEVPDFQTHPKESLNNEHFSHFTAFHLRALLAMSGLDVLEIGRNNISRYFGLLAVACFKQEKHKQDFDDVEDVDAVIQNNKSLYKQALKDRNEEEGKALSLASRILTLVKQHEPRNPRIYFWGANPFATLIGTKLRDVGYEEALIVDNSSSKIGSAHEGFKHHIIPPVFNDQAQVYKIFVLCSQAWNDQISQQIQRDVQGEYSIIEAVSPEGNVLVEN